MNLAENCKAHLPPWLNYTLYVFAESAIIATDIAEVRFIFMYLRDAKLIEIEGYWHCHCFECTSAYPAGGGLRDIHCRRPDHSYLLQPLWNVHARITHFRRLCCSTRPRRCDMLRLPTQPHQGRRFGGSLSRLSSLFSLGPVQGVSSCIYISGLRD
jgi:hypothetical protein